MARCRFRDTELEASTFRGADLPEADLAQARSIKGAVFLRSAGDEEWALLADHAPTRNWIGWNPLGALQAAANSLLTP